MYDLFVSHDYGVTYVREDCREQHDKIYNQPYEMINQK